MVWYWGYCVVSFAAVRCSPNLSLIARLVCPMYSAGVFGVLLHCTTLYHVNEIFICTFDRLLDEVSLASVLNVHDDIPSLMKGQVLHLMELHFFMKGVFEVGVVVCFSLALIPQEETKLR